MASAIGAEGSLSFRECRASLLRGSGGKVWRGANNPGSRKDGFQVRAVETLCAGAQGSGNWRLRELSSTGGPVISACCQYYS